MGQPAETFLFICLFVCLPDFSRLGSLFAS